MLRRIFVLMLENRSFDHLLGFSGVEGWDPVQNRVRIIDGADAKQHFNYFNPLAGTGAKLYVRSPAVDSIAGLEKDPAHEFSDTLLDLCGPNAVVDYQKAQKYPGINNSGFLYKYGRQGGHALERVMEICEPDQIPNIVSLAREYAVCDRWFSSMPGPTWPNRFFAHAGTSGGLDDSPSNLEVLEAMKFGFGYQFPRGTIYDALDRKGIDWVIYEGDSYPQSYAIKGMKQHLKKGRFRDLKYFEDDVRSKQFTRRYVFIEPNYGRITDSFKGGNSQHPLDSISSGEWLIGHIYKALSQSPHWEESALIVTYDEHGGFYDHVGPPVAVGTGDDTRYSKNHFDFSRYGVRVPTVIASPLIRKHTDGGKDYGLVDGTLYDHTSILKTAEVVFGLPSLTERDSAANDFTHLFSPHTLTPLIQAMPRFVKTTTVRLATGIPVSEDLEHDRLARARRTVGDEARLVEEQRNTEQDVEDGPPHPSVFGFLLVAYLRDLALNEDQPRLLEESSRQLVLSTQSTREAARYLRQVRERVQAYKLATQAPGQMDEPTR
ncbi:MAG TPA: alkaline phosphatase family protein [Nitrospira sp.]|nr:alkaline phosphatase family protein [Nitrospira sp.]